MSFRSIEAYIPQRPPFVMVGELVEYTPNEAKTRLRITADNFFCCKACFIEPGLIENMAQTAAALEGCRAIAAGEEVRVGFITSLKALKILRLPSLGDCIETQAKIEYESASAKVIKAAVHLNDERIASVQFTVFLHDTP